MKNKASLCRMGITLILTLLIQAGCSKSQGLQSSQGNAWSVLTNAQFNSLDSTIWELAAQKWQADATNDKTIVLALHTNSFDVLKYTDGRLIVIDIPIIDPEEIEGLCTFASDYNQFNVRKADLLAKGGTYEDARAIYQTVIHFSPSGLGKEKVKQKLLLLDKLNQNQDVGLNRQKLADLCEDYGALTPWSNVAAATPKVVTNLLALPAQEFKAVGEP